MKNPTIPNIAADLSVEQQTELGDLDPLLTALAADEAPQPSPGETTRLLAQLRPLVAARATPLPEWLEPQETGVRAWLRLAWSQTSLLETPFWYASGGMIVLGLLLGVAGGGGLLALMFLFLSPVLAAAGVAYAFRPATRTLWELEQAAPIRPLELLYARLALIFAGNVALACAVLSVVWMGVPGLVVWRLIVAWLGPMLFLAGTALYTSVRWGSVAGIAVPLSIWAGLITLGWQELADRMRPAGLNLIDVLLPLLSASDGLLAGSLAALIAGVLLLRQGGRLALGERVAWS